MASQGGSTYEPRMAERRLADLLLSLVTLHGRSATRNRRYVLAVVVPLFLIWAGLGLYLVLASKVFTSEMTLILPSASSSSNFSLDAIGQATTSTSSPFSSNSLSPKIAYKAIAESARVRGLAAKSLGVPFDEIDKPKIELIDETSLMMFKVSGKSPEQARAKGEALLAALQQQLDQLRADEIQRRSESIRAGISEVEKSLDDARRRLVAFQQGGSIVASTQLTALSSQIDDVAKRIDEMAAERDQVNSQRQSLAGTLGVTPATAALALRFQGDPRYDALAKEHADALAALVASSRRWGPQHPKVEEAAAQVKASEDSMVQLALSVSSDLAGVSLENLLLVNTKDRSELFRSVVELDAKSKGLDSGIQSMRGTLAAMQNKLETLSASAAKLDDLERDYKIAEAVFSSALARIDSGRQDIFASYPLVQVMSPPSLPESPSSPRLLYVLIGGIGATLFILMALLLAWLRIPFVQRLSKSA